MHNRAGRHSQPPQSKEAKAVLARVIAQICLLAGLIDFLYLLFFGAIGATLLAWINVVSMAIYLSAFTLVRWWRLRPAVLLIWAESFSHAVLGTLMLGWDSGFYYLLLMFVPLIVIGSPRRRAWVFIASILVFLSALRYLSHDLGPLAPISSLHLEWLNWGNFVLFVVMFAGAADYYRGQMAKVEAMQLALATTDTLTGLFNRRHFNEISERAVAQARRTKSPCAVALLDIDHFKSFNDTHGHEAGDRVLVSVAQTLGASLRESDVLARWGGEEFVLLMADTEMSGALIMAERIRSAVEASEVRYGSVVLRCTISIGLSMVQADQGFNAVMVKADNALYQSKAAGRNRVTAL